MDNTILLLSPVDIFVMNIGITAAIVVARTIRAEANPMSFIRLSIWEN